jgi:hypothetical protein
MAEDFCVYILEGGEEHFRLVKHQCISVPIECWKVANRCSELRLLHDAMLQAIEREGAKA